LFSFVTGEKVGNLSPPKTKNCLVLFNNKKDIATKSIPPSGIPVTT
jgi:hypothetical protein